jgi:hypothetical protein
LVRDLRKNAQPLGVPDAVAPSISPKMNRKHLLIASLGVGATLAVSYAHWSNHDDSAATTPIYPLTPRDVSGVWTLTASIEQPQSGFKISAHDADGKPTTSATFDMEVQVRDGLIAECAISGRTGVATDSLVLPRCKIQQGRLHIEWGARFTFVVSGAADGSIIGDTFIDRGIAGGKLRIGSARMLSAIRG